ncbi:PREDICTED: ras-related and estrogen-regulated growth inhibitor isoform X1 [Condylura cristata]|uniref:ras-related and estrogen-regulated growth inhibitor isoform X1 n=1 Tax=Condylura cristata TaxID=143302 RepID=UPI0006436397|nr:PREDICTED: ras-related and estrogen-regulated growth inhibitor isoform X1 [Condylura cristata]
MAKSAEVKLAIFGRAGVGKSDFKRSMPCVDGNMKRENQTRWLNLRAICAQLLCSADCKALIVRFLTRRFIWEYDPTLESTYRHQANIDDEVVTMEILDTAGQEDTIQREGHMRWGEGFVLVYDITDRGSFEEVLPLKNILDEIKKPKNVTLILVGNKADLDHSRQVSTEEGEKLASELACAFYECSACTGEGNITEIFYELCREVRRRRMVQGKTRRRSSTTHVKQAINKMLTKISS